MVTRYSLQEATPKELVETLADALGLERHGAELRCPLPSHEDSRTSAGIFGVPASAYYGSPAHGRWKCQGCGVGGDAFELVMQARPDWSNAESEAWLVAWLATDPAPAPATGETNFDEDRVRRAVRRRVEAAALVAGFFADNVTVAGERPDAAWARRTFHLGASGERLYFPYLTDAGGEESSGRRRCVGAMYRWPQGRGTWGKQCEPGSARRDVLYGEWRDADQPVAVICEGESDTIAVAWWLREWPNAVVLGVPGASATLTDGIAERLAARRVVLVPDQDEAGTQWAQRWSVGVRQTSPASVAVAVLPPGQDACKAGRTAVVAALRRAAQPRNRRERRAHLQPR